MKKILAIILSLLLALSLAAPAMAYDAVAENSVSTVSVREFSFLDSILNFLHSIIEKICSLFGFECPLCKDDDMDEEEVPDFIPAEIEEAVALYNAAVNVTKMAENEYMQIRKTSDVQCEVTDTSVSAVTNVINTVLQNLTGETEEVYRIRNGSDEYGRTLATILPPFDREAALTVDAVAIAEAYIENNEIVLRIVLREEESYYDGATTVEPVYNLGVGDPLNLATLDIAPLEVTSAEMLYTGTTLEIKLDSNRNLVYLKTYMPMEGTAAAKMSGGVGIAFMVALEGALTETYEIIY